jgi:hypothetical protein
MHRSSSTTGRFGMVSHQKNKTMKSYELRIMKLNFLLLTSCSAVSRHENSTDEPKNQGKMDENGIKSGIRESLIFDFEKPEGFLHQCGAL